MGSESKSRNGGGEGEVATAKGVPATAKKVVQSVKEIVDCTEQEIYAALKECDMDPNSAVEKLLTQGFGFSPLCFPSVTSFLQWNIFFFFFSPLPFGVWMQGKLVKMIEVLTSFVYIFIFVNFDAFLRFFSRD